ncbi:MULTISPECIES: hypothetical protein [unclassified Streptomyces]|uniref:hypothetical protein n=1 Tax=unclassified Streptomyces TaxID=2593676 RepID=UPI00226FD32B|nr:MULTISPECIES: hypothetical protein [unclassified Streptomyces]MCY0921859.1 hypothetical protein [Streptomyces sp. H27-G5]MCY0957191.1 hypothetical protein [Streptomyces sp. H27-H5]
MIENTTDATALAGMVAGALLGRSPDELIAGQEQRGQEQLVTSDRLPTEILRGDRASFEALGFQFGAADPADPLFVPASLPDGWTREASDHPMWSYILDDLGRRRVAIFYKAAFYDRCAEMQFVTLFTYLRDHVYEGRPLITDPVWATPQALAVEARLAITRAEEELAFWRGHEQTTFADGTSSEQYAAQRCEGYRARRDQYAAVLATLDTEEQQP